MPIKKEQQITIYDSSSDEVRLKVFNYTVLVTTCGCDEYHDDRIGVELERDDIKAVIKFLQAALKKIEN